MFYKIRVIKTVLLAQRVDKLPSGTEQRPWNISTSLNHSVHDRGALQIRGGKEGSFDK